MRGPLWLVLLTAIVAFGCSAPEPSDTPAEAPSGAVFGLETDPDESAEAASGEGEASDESAPEVGTYETLDESYHHSEVSLISQGDSTLLPFVEPMRRARQHP